jgi:hypothetical protein
MKTLRRQLILTMMISLGLHGQTADPQPESQQSRTNELSPSSVGGESSVAVPALSNDRLFYALPNFLTVENAGDVPPMTAGQKFQATARSVFDPMNLAWYGLLAGIGQAQNSEPGYHQGWTGYEKRYAAFMGDGVIENFSTQAVMPALFHQDPRYFQSGEGGYWRRTGHAVSHIFVTRSDSGKAQFNYSEILGSAAASGISTYAYHPRDDRNLANVGSVWASQVAYDALSYVIKEFWPDIRRKMTKVKR